MTWTCKVQVTVFYGVLLREPYLDDEAPGVKLVTRLKRHPV